MRVLSSFTVSEGLMVEYILDSQTKAYACVQGADDDLDLEEFVFECINSDEDKPYLSELKSKEVIESVELAIGTDYYELNCVEDDFERNQDALMYDCENHPVLEEYVELTDDGESVIINPMIITQILFDNIEEVN